MKSSDQLATVTPVSASPNDHSALISPTFQIPLTCRTSIRLPILKIGSSQIRTGPVLSRAKGRTSGSPGPYDPSVSANGDRVLMVLVTALSKSWPTRGSLVGTRFAMLGTFLRRMELKSNRGVGFESLVT